MNKSDYLNALQNSKYFLSTSTSEACGSRSLLQAINLGLYPVITKECESALSICREFDGNCNSYISINDSAEQAVNKIIQIMNSQLTLSNKSYIRRYNDELEIIKLISCIENTFFDFIYIRKKHFLTHVIRRFVHNIVLEAGLSTEKISDIQSNLKTGLTNKNVLYKFDKIWDDSGMPIASLYGFKQQMNKVDFDIYKNFIWIFV